MTTKIEKLHVLYDAQCALCHRCKDWLSSLSCYVKLEFVALQTPDIDTQFPGIHRQNPERQICVVADNGAVYQGPRAWIMCLWATKKYRSWSLRFANPMLMPAVGKFCELVSENRLLLSNWLFLRKPPELLNHIESTAARESKRCTSNCNLSS